MHIAAPRYKNAAAVEAAATGPRSSEYWLVFAMLLATAVFPAISKYHGADVGSSANPYAEVVWSLLYLIAGLRLIAMRTTALALVKRTWPLVILMAFTLLSVLWSVLPQTTFVNAIEIIGTSAIVYYAAVRFSLEQFLEIFSLTLGAIGLLSLAMIFLAPGHGRMDYGSGAWTGIYQEKNNLSAAMALAIVSMTVLLFGGNWKKRVLVLAGLILSTALLLGAKSATATVGTLAAEAVVLGGLFLRSKRLTTTWRILIIVTLAFSVLLFVGLGFSADSVLSMLGRDTNLTGRTDFWPYLQSAIGDRPVLGYGYNAFFRSSEGADYLSTYIIEAGGWTPYHSHNSFIQISLDGGYVGLTLFIIVLLRATFRALKSLVTSTAAVTVWPLAIIVYLVIGSYTETYFMQCNTFEWICFMAALLFPLREAIAARPRRPS